MPNRNGRIVIKNIELNKDDAKVDLIKLIPTIFLDEKGNADVWLEVWLANIGRKDFKVNSIQIVMDEPVSKMICSSELYKDERDDPRPYWSGMYDNFNKESTSLVRFFHTVGEDNIRTTPVNFECSYSDDDRVTTLYNFRDFEGNEVEIKPPKNNHTIPELDSILFYISWKEPNLSSLIDEPSMYFDYLIEVENTPVKYFYAFFILPIGAIFTGSASVIPLYSFSIKKRLKVFTSWLSQYKILKAKEGIVIRAESKGKNEFFLSGNYTVPKKRIIKTISYFTIALIAGILFNLFTVILFQGVPQKLHLWGFLGIIGSLSIAILLILKIMKE